MTFPLPYDTISRREDSARSVSLCTPVVEAITEPVTEAVTAAHREGQPQ